MCLLDHIYVIRTVANRQGYFSQVVFDKTNYIGFFFGGDSAADHTFAFGHHLVDELVLEFMECQQFG